MKRIFLLFALSNACSGFTQGDSLMLQAALSRDFSAWQRAQSAPGLSEVWEPFASQEPPIWAAYGDSAMWIFAQWAAPTVAYSMELTSVKNAELKVPEQEEPSAVFWLIIASTGMGALLLLLSIRRSAAKNLPEDLVPLHLFLLGDREGQEKAQEIWHAWRDTITNNADHISRLSAFDLTKTELDVALKIMKGMSVHEIATQLHCTTAYIYNVRSSLRKKIESEESLPLERQLRKLIE
ncbi:MAG: helix-turn-helix transcriptional regulator [Flavobacteriales bacterium]